MIPLPPAATQPPGRIGVLGVSLLVFLASVAVAIAVPVLQRMQRETRARAVAAELRAAASAFQAYAHERGDWPPADAPPGHPPAGMADHLRDMGWTQPSPLGGYFAWKRSTLHQGQRYAAAIAIASAGGSRVRLDREELLELDRLIDDGEFATGNFRLGFRHQPLFVLEH